MRSVPAWKGLNDNTAIPARVKVRVWARCGGRCQSCGKLIYVGEKHQFDHIVALANAGENSESNLQLLCFGCHVIKSKGDVAEKSRAYRVRSKHIGIKKRQIRPMPGTRASGIRKRMSGKIEQWK